MVLPADPCAARRDGNGRHGRPLGLWTLEGFDAISDRLAVAVADGEVEREVLQKFIAFAAEVTPDQQGRVVLPQVLAPTGARERGRGEQRPRPGRAAADH